MKLLKKIVKWVLYILSIPAAYLLISLILTYIPVHVKGDSEEKMHTIYLHSNGVHLDIALPIEQMDSTLLEGLKYDHRDRYLSFGWGDKNFYLNTPTWGDLTAKNAFRALFITSPSLIHLTRYTQRRNHWAEINLDQKQANSLSKYIQQTFALDQNEQKILLVDQGYSYRDDFYEATGSFSAFRTCNSWVNGALKNSDVKACLWTPFDFRLLNMHKKNKR